MLRERDCAALRDTLLGGGRVTVSLADRGTRPVDGAFDNGVVAHEYGHGISNRLIGGPSATTCLLNDEQMGEGWSDFFYLASTPRSTTPEPTGREARGIGLYSLSAPDGERGFRSSFYSTDSDVNRQSYDDVITAAVPHGVGEVWAATLWDVYWKLVETYGFDEDLIHGSGGSNRAVRLVIEAMKYTPCSPGYLDGRDGLLLADRFVNGGADECLLWEVFARRGLGYSAEQGAADRSNDNREAFDRSPGCIPTVKILKRADRLYVDAGDTVLITLTVRNDKADSVSGIRIVDELPAGLTVDPASFTGPGSWILDGERITISLNDLPAGDSISLGYLARTDPAWMAERQDLPDWDFLALQGNRGWTRVDTGGLAGEGAWFVPNISGDQDQVLQLRMPVVVTGPAPVLRFFTCYDTEPAYDAGVLEVSPDGENWQSVGDRFLRHAYRGSIDGRGKPTLRGQPSFWGNSQGYREAIVDLRDFRDQAVYVRWRFVSDASRGAEGWYVDEIELLPELVRYDGQVRVNTREGDRESSSLPGPGVVVNAGAPGTVAIDPAPPESSGISLFPNPVRDLLMVQLPEAGSGSLRLQIYSAAGRPVRERVYDSRPGTGKVIVNLGGLPSGAYVLHVAEGSRVFRQTFILQP